MIIKRSQNKRKWIVLLRPIVQKNCIKKTLGIYIHTNKLLKKNELTKSIKMFTLL